MQRRFFDNSSCTLVLMVLVLTGASNTMAQWQPMAMSMRAMEYAPPMAIPQFLNYDGRYASAPPGLPLSVARVVVAANELQRKPYVWGGGHRVLNDRGYDCSGSVSYVLHKAGLLRGPLTAREFHAYGARGPGRFITIYARGDHVFLSVCGLRFDTTDSGAGRGNGPKWRPTSRDFRGFEIRHIPGL